MLISHEFFKNKNNSSNLIILLARGIAPSPRAAHASTNVDSLQLVVYGGATGGKFALLFCVRIYHQINILTEII